jgi:uncharacterized protein YdcH (DUF465 family)
MVSRRGGERMLDGIDVELIERVKRENEEFGRLLAEHEEYESQLETFNGLRYLTSEQEMARKQLQKRKLLGKDRMLAILSQYEAS